MRNIEKAIPIFLLFLFGVIGIGASLTFADHLREEPKPQPEFTTRFYVINESEMVFGKPAFYRMIIENQEGTTADYDLKVRLAGKIIYDQEIRLNSSGSLNQTVSFIPNQTGDYQKLEFLLYKDNEPYRTRVFQVFRATDYGTPDLTVTPISPQDADTRREIGMEITENYSKQWIGDIIVYTFNTGEKLELKVSNETVGKEDAVYITASKGNNIIFLGETYEKLLPGTAKYINPVIINALNITLKVNDTFKLKNGYAVTLNLIDDQSVKFTISKGNEILREILSPGNSPIEYWQEINEYKKQKMMQITPQKIDQDRIVLDLIQYGGNTIVTVGNRYGEFQVTAIYEDSIILKNIQDIKIEPGKEISLIKGKIKIKV